MVDPDMPQMTIQYVTCALHAGYLSLHIPTHKRRLCNKHCLSTATTLARTCVIVTSLRTLPALFALFSEKLDILFKHFMFIISLTDSSANTVSSLQPGDRETCFDSRYKDK